MFFHGVKVVTLSKVHMTLIRSLLLSLTRFWRMLEDERPTLLQMNFSGYHQVRITEEEQSKNTFAT
jgi:uncharacterized protein YpbB